MRIDWIDTKTLYIRDEDTWLRVNSKLVSKLYTILTGELDKIRSVERDEEDKKKKLEQVENWDKLKYDIKVGGGNIVDFIKDFFKHDNRKLYNGEDKYSAYTDIMYNSSDFSYMSVDKNTGVTTIDYSYPLYDNKYIRYIGNLSGDETLELKEFLSDLFKKVESDKVRRSDEIRKKFIGTKRQIEKVLEVSEKLQYKIKNQRLKLLN